MALNFCVQHDENGNITGTWGPSEMDPPIREHQLVLPGWVDVTNKRVDMDAKCLVDCPILLKQQHNMVIEYKLYELDVKKQRALFEGLRNNDWTWFDKHEAAAVELRKQLK